MYKYHSSAAVHTRPLLRQEKERGHDGADVLCVAVSSSLWFALFLQGAIEAKHMCCCFVLFCYTKYSVFSYVCVTCVHIKKPFQSVFEIERRIAGQLNQLVIKSLGFRLLLC